MGHKKHSTETTINVRTFLPNLQYNKASHNVEDDYENFIQKTPHSHDDALIVGWAF